MPKPVGKTGRGGSHARIDWHTRRRRSHRNLHAAVTCAVAGISNATQGAYTMAMMQTTIVYDTHAAVLRLTETGMPEPQAVAVVREQSLLLEHNLATKADIELVKADIEALRQETKAGIEALRQETKAGIAAVQANVEKLSLKTAADIATVHAKIEAAKNGIILWVVGLNVAMVGLMIAAARLL